jgi:hypothetical protein
MKIEFEKRDLHALVGILCDASEQYYNEASNGPANKERLERLGETATRLRCLIEQALDNA